MQITELTTRLDTVESSIKKDIRNILEILKQQSDAGRKRSDDEQIDENRLQRTQQQSSIEKQNILMASSYQRSESDFSFDHQQHRMPTASTSQVHRSISQPECTQTDKSLLRYTVGGW